MTASCGCQPGTPENGWHETRSPACEEKEREAWRQMLARAEEGRYLRPPTEQH